jgi:hypothetical protein
MLAGAFAALAARSHRLTSVAPTTRSLAALGAALGDSGCVPHVLALDVGSTSGNLEAGADDGPGSLEARPAAVANRQVDLGAHRSDDGVRWSTHQETSGGVLEAIELGQSRYAVGVMPA